MRGWGWMGRRDETLLREGGWGLAGEAVAEMRHRTE